MMIRRVYFPLHHNADYIKSLSDNEKKIYIIKYLLDITEKTPNNLVDIINRNFTQYKYLIGNVEKYRSLI